MNLLNLYILNTVNTSIASLGTPTLELQIGNEYDFEVVQIMAKIYDATTQAGAVLCSIRLSGGQYLTENPLDLNMFATISGAGVSMENYGIRVPWTGAILPSNTKVFFDLNNLTGDTVEVQLAIIGRKIWKV